MVVLLLHWVHVNRDRMLVLEESTYEVDFKIHALDYSSIRFFAKFYVKVWIRSSFFNRTDFVKTKTFFKICAHRNTGYFEHAKRVGDDTRWENHHVHVWLTLKIEKATSLPNLKNSEHSWRVWEFQLFLPLKITDRTNIETVWLKLKIEEVTNLLNLKNSEHSWRVW